MGQELQMYEIIAAIVEGYYQVKLRRSCYRTYRS